MKTVFSPGDKKIFSRTVEPSDSASFAAGQVHPVYSTFALARDAEWACRLFVLDMKEEHEEGIGTFISVEHLSPALIGESITFTAALTAINRNEIVCSYIAETGGRLIARGEQKQKILVKEKIDALFLQLHNNSH
jgi:predicted thioesterase